MSKPIIASPSLSLQPPHGLAACSSEAISRQSASPADTPASKLGPSLCALYEREASLPNPRDLPPQDRNARASGLDWDARSLDLVRRMRLFLQQPF